MVSVPILQQDVELKYLSLFRQGHGEGGAAAGSRVDSDSAFVHLDDLVDDRKAETGAVGFGGEERLEDPVKVLMRDAFSIVPDADYSLPFLL